MSARNDAYSKSLAKAEFVSKFPSVGQITSDNGATYDTIWKSADGRFTVSYRDHGNIRIRLQFDASVKNPFTCCCPKCKFSLPEFPEWAKHISPCKSGFYARKSFGTKEAITRAAEAIEFMKAHEATFVEAYPAKTAEEAAKPETSTMEAPTDSPSFGEIVDSENSKVA